MRKTENRRTLSLPFGEAGIRLRLETRTCDSARGRIPPAVLILFSLAFALMTFPSSAQDGHAYLGADAGLKTGDFSTPTRSNPNYLAPVLGYVASQRVVFRDRHRSWLALGLRRQYNEMRSGHGN